MISIAGHPATYGDYYRLLRDAEYNARNPQPQRGRRWEVRMWRFKKDIETVSMCFSCATLKVELASWLRCDTRIILKFQTMRYLADSNLDRCQKCQKQKVQTLKSYKNEKNRKILFKNDAKKNLCSCRNLWWTDWLFSRM